MATVDLDDPAQLKAGDPSGMLDVTASFPEAWQANRAGHEAPDPPDNIRNIVIAGMGGSGIVGDVARAVLEPVAPFPVAVAKDYQPARYVGPETLVLAISYSGDTEETLDYVGHAHGEGAQVAVVCSGGALAAAADKHGWTRLAVEPGMQPRAALPHLAAAAIGWLGRMDEVQIEAADLDHLKRLRDTMAADAPSDENVAKTWAMAVHDGMPIVYGWGSMAVAAQRLKCQFNENSKMFARAETLPEANHNDVVPWAEAGLSRELRLLLLRTPREPRAIAARYSYLTSLAGAAGVPVGDFSTSDRTVLGGLLSGILFGDFVSVYTGILRGVDPTPVDAISGLKQTLRAEGRRDRAITRLGLES